MTTRFERAPSTLMLALLLAFSPAGKAWSSDPSPGAPGSPDHDDHERGGGRGHDVDAGHAHGDESEHAAHEDAAAPAGEGATPPADPGHGHEGEGNHAHGARAGAAGEKDDGHAHGGEDEHGAGELMLSDQELERYGVGVQVAGPGTVDLYVELPGEIRPNGDRLAHIVPRYPGIVREVRKTIGDAVRAGDVLAVVESSESLAPYQLTTAIDGTVLEKDITRGEAVDRQKGVFLIADLSNVWVDLAVFQKDLPQIALGQRVRISAGEGMPDAEGTISYITPTVDPRTRTVTARVVLDNAQGQWRPGMFVTARALEPMAASLVVPLAAVQIHDGSPVVFIVAGGRVMPRDVTLGRRGATQVELLAGLAPGERYVAANSFLIKAELGKSEAEHSH